MVWSVSDNDRFQGRRAVVCGGSMAGLLTARVLSGHFDEVTVVERDVLAEGSREPRKGAPQGRQLHALLKKGEEIMRDLFPDLLPALAEAGAVTVDFGRDITWYHFGVWKKPFESGLLMTCLSRPLLEAEVRRRVFALPNVRLRDACDVLGLASSAGGARVTGVRVKARGGAGTEETLDAELVVDASGRGSKLPEWLEAMGCGRPEETAVKVQVGYASRLYKMPDPWKYPWKGMYILGAPPGSKRLGALFPREGGQLICVLAGFLGEHPPDDPEGYLEFARGLPVDDLHRVLLDLEPAGDVAVYKFPANLRRHYDRLTRFPDGLAVVGDAMASFNPIYGQGMTTAGLDALELDACLRAQRRERGPGDLTGLSRRYLAAAAKLTDGPWQMTTGEDFRHPEVEGQRPPLYGAMKWYLGQVHRAAAVDEQIYGYFLRAMHMLDGPEKLLSPRTALRVLRSARRAPG
jgi:2-polyprenyl-6-methoxyphenol hydroxylase-like FAD-dependent oxidoreductase